MLTGKRRLLRIIRKEVARDDCDTLTAIAGSIAEGFYGVSAELKEECYKRLPDPLLKGLKMFEEKK